MNWKEQLAQAEKLFAQAKQILSDQVPDGDETRESTSEERDRVPEMLEDAKALKAKALQLQEVEREGKELAAQRKSAEAEALKVAEKQNKESQEPQAKLGGFKEWGEFLYAVWSSRVSGQKDERLTYFKDEAPISIQTKDMTEGVGAAGGFLVPVEFQAQLQGVMAEETSIRARCTRIPMRRRQVDIPVLDQTGTTAGIPHWFGGMRFYWQEEATEKTESDASFRKVSLVAHKLIGLTCSPYVGRPA